MSAGLSFFSLSFFSFFSFSSSFSLESKCSLQMCSNCCTFNTLPEPGGRADAREGTRPEQNRWFPDPPSTPNQPGPAQTDLHRHRRPLVCWRSYGTVLTQPVARPGWPRWPHPFLPKNKGDTLSQQVSGTDLDRSLSLSCPTRHRKALKLAYDVRPVSTCACAKTDRHPSHHFLTAAKYYWQKWTFNASLFVSFDLGCMSELG